MGLCMIEDIKKVLKDLIGLKLTNIRRIGYMMCIQFGYQYYQDKDGNECNLGEFTFHIEIPWRFTNESVILIGSNDIYKPIDENALWEENFDPDGSNGNLRDYKIDNMMKEFELFVQDVKLDNYGGLDILFNHEITFTVFPNESVRINDEHWRLMDFRNAELDEKYINSKKVVYNCEHYVYWSSKRDFENEE